MSDRPKKEKTSKQEEELRRLARENLHLRQQFEQQAVIQRSQEPSSAPVDPTPIQSVSTAQHPPAEPVARSSGLPQPGHPNLDSLSEAINEAQARTEQSFLQAQDALLSTSNQQLLLEDSFESPHDQQNDSRPLLPARMDSVANYFADKIETNIQRLKGNNWATWKWQLMNVLDAKNLSAVLESTEPRGSPKELATRKIISGSYVES